MELIERISNYVIAHPEDIGAYNDYFSSMVEMEKPITDVQHWHTPTEHEFLEAHRHNRIMRQCVTNELKHCIETGTYTNAEALNDYLFKSLVFGARYYFADYLQAVEFGKRFDKKFYAPRSGYLKPYVEAYQDILDGNLDVLSISMPKRMGKSQTGINFVNMISGKFPNRATLMEGTGDDLVKSFYKGCLEYLETPSEYHFYDIFPDSKLVQTNADAKTINLNTKSRFPTIMCRSIDSRQVGLSEATNVLYLDDCVEGREEAKNRQRLDDKWEIISGDIMGRAIEGTPLVIAGTRYSIYDPIGHIQDEARKQGKRLRVIEIPALDPVTDESNFEHERDGVKVFTTKYFRDQRDMLAPDQFEAEFQQQPYEAHGLLFPEKELNYFYELPVDKEPDTIMAVCDTAESGEDFLAMPIAAVYGSEVYIIDVVFDDSTPEVTKPECAKKLMENKVVSCTFESNNAGEYFARDVDNILSAKGYRCSIRKKRTISNKQTRIEFASDNIIKKFYFRANPERNSQYYHFMKQVTSHTRTGKVKHDDAPDSLSLLENELRGLIGGGVEVVKRMW